MYEHFVKQEGIYYSVERASYGAILAREDTDWSLNQFVALNRGNNVHITFGNVFNPDVFMNKILIVDFYLINGIPAI